MKLLLVFMCCICYINALLNCKNEAGKTVDVWTIMKFPKSTDYYYYDENVGFLYSNFSLNDTTCGALANTLTQLWRPDVNYIVYNDEPPNQTVYNFSVAHSKGIWIWDNENVLLITHSIPKFPESPSLKNNYSGLMQNAWEYGQVLSCLTFPVFYLGTGLELIYKTNPLIYDIKYNKSDNLSISKLSVLNNSCLVYELNNTYTMFVKESTTEVDIWTSCITDYYENNIMVESWIHGTMDGPYCYPEYNFDTLDIQSLRFPNGKEFIEYDDHSKWGIVNNSSTVCFGDLNRVTTQKTRSGTVYCWENQELHKYLLGFIQTTNNC